MKDNYFNKYEFRNAVLFMEEDPYWSKTLLENYISRYPKDYTAFTYYINNLIILGKFEDANILLEKLSKIIEEDKDDYSLTGKTGYLKEKMFYSKIKLLSYNHKYRELLNLCNSSELKNTDINISRIRFYCRKKLGKTGFTSRENKSYFYRQVLEYSYDDFLYHIREHLPEYNSDPTENKFNENINIDKVLSEIKKIIPNSEKLYPGFFEDVYYFKCDNCGNLNSKSLNYIKVVCFHDTSDIISLFPVSEGDKIPHIDLTYMIYDDQNKVRTKSQIDRFYSRYKK